MLAPYFLNVCFIPRHLRTVVSHERFSGLSPTLVADGDRLLALVDIAPVVRCFRQARANTQIMVLQWVQS